MENYNNSNSKFVQTSESIEKSQWQVMTVVDKEQWNAPAFHVGK